MAKLEREAVRLSAVAATAVASIVSDSKLVSLTSRHLGTGPTPHDTFVRHSPAWATVVVTGWLYRSRHAWSLFREYDRERANACEKDRGVKKRRKTERERERAGGGGDRRIGIE